MEIANAYASLCGVTERVFGTFWNIISLPGLNFGPLEFSLCFRTFNIIMQIILL